MSASDSVEESLAPRVLIGDRTVALREGESVLEGLERDGVDVPSGCRAGSCCKCMLRAEGAAPPGSQKTLRPTLQAQGYFLSCQARPVGALRIHDNAPPIAVEAYVHGTELVAPDVVRILLRPESALAFRPGQYLDVLHPSGAARSYSIASLPDDGLLELHVRLVPDGLVSSWLHNLAESARVQVRGAFGQCFHLADDPEKKLLLVGAGTGLAPLLGIARDALAQGHVGPIDLVHGGLQPDRLYLRRELEELAEGPGNLRVHHCVLRNGTEREHEGRLDQVAIRLAGPLRQARAFLCGDAEIVRVLQKSLFLAGVPSGEILADPFLPAAISPHAPQC